MRIKSRLIAMVQCAAWLLLGTPILAQEIGAFEGSQDIGSPMRPGNAAFLNDSNAYRVTGGGANMWARSDAFHYAFKKISGDVSIAADIEIVGKDGDPHRKAGVLIRQSLDADSAYADVVVHGDGLSSLQYRDEKGQLTREIQANISSPQRVRIDKVGNYVWMSLQTKNVSMEPAGGAFRLMLKEPFYVGLAVCAHNDNATETALFKNVVIESIQASPPGANGRIESTLEVVPISSGDRRVVYHRIGSQRFEAPNWTQDDQLIFNDAGLLYSIPVDGLKPPKQIKTGALNKLNNDHGVSPDGKWIAISDQTQPGGSRIYVIPIDGGEPKLVTEKAPSYWHGWSPDGKSMVYCANRNDNYDVYSISANGGEERRLTVADGLDDGPEYSPSGEWIYFNSMRSGTMQIWKMQPDSSNLTQVTNDQFQNWFAHPSPDGKWLVFISYSLEVAAGDHPANKDTMLRLMRTDGSGEIQVLAKLFGGQGTLNVPSWSPDSRRVAFVSYRLVP